MQENLHSVTTKPFVWGDHDCALFAGDHIKAITGVDLITDYRGKYSNALGAIKILKEHGYNNLEELCKTNFPEINPVFSNVGDIILVNDEANEALGGALTIVLGEVLGVLTPGGYGIIRRSDKRIKTGYKIG